jgi:hypothetical protein
LCLLREEQMSYYKTWRICHFFRSLISCPPSFKGFQNCY